MSALALSSLDELRFGVRTAKASVETVTEVRDAIEQSHAQRARLLIVRIPTSAQPAVSAMEQAGGRLMDTLCFYEHHLMRRPLREIASTGDGRAPNWRLASADDADAVEALARVAFEGYESHYRHDPRLAPAAVDEVYPSWARSCCESSSDFEPVVLAEVDARLVGFAALRRTDSAELDVALFGIDPAARGQGIAVALLDHLLAACPDWGATRLRYSTQITNLPMLRLLARTGFRSVGSVYTFHLWLEVES